MNLNQEQMAALRAISDWNLDVQDVGMSAVFPGPAPVASGDGFRSEFATLLAAEVTRGHKEKVNGRRKTFGIECEGIRYRVQPLEYPYFQLRTLHDKPLPIDKLGLSRIHTDILLSRELRNQGGLLLVGGPTGAGKTTTLSSTVIARLEKFGGYALTLEDVIEYQMNGWHGKRGLCRQIQIQSDYQTEMRGALRAFPSSDRSMLMFGEIVDGVSAGELLRTALDGNLVMATMHGNTIVGMLERLVAIAKREMDVAEARSLLSKSLRVVVHQIREHQVPQVTLMNLTDHEEASGALGIIGDPERRLFEVDSFVQAQELRYKRAMSMN